MVDARFINAHDSSMNTHGRFMNTHDRFMNRHDRFMNYGGRFMSVTVLSSSKITKAPKIQGLLNKYYCEYRRTLIALTKSSPATLPLYLQWVRWKKYTD